MADEKKLDLVKLFKESGTRLPVFVGTLVHAGLQHTYEEEVEKMKKGAKPKAVMTLSEFQKAKMNFLKEKN